MISPRSKRPSGGTARRFIEKVQEDPAALRLGSDSTTSVVASLCRDKRPQGTEGLRPDTFMF
ncbi:MAG: hypothetical protein HN763_08090 [Opitutales bacterium]|nr:hypothetical protein [Opitutales bacterium]